MANKQLKFSIFQLIIETNIPFTMETFSLINDSDLETFEIGAKEEKETLSIKRVSKECVEDRFVTLYFNEGNKFPYSPKVIDATDLKEKDNPRPAEDIELDDQFFILIDILTQRIYLSDQRKKGTFAIWLKDKINKEVNIKSIIDEEDFLTKIKSINKISLTIVPNLFNSSSQDILSHSLVSDIYGFGAERATLNMDYFNSNITENIKNKFSAILNRRTEFKDVTVIGRSTEGFESVFNLEEVISKLVIDIQTQAETNLLEHTIVFNLLIGRIKDI